MSVPRFAVGVVMLLSLGIASPAFGQEPSGSASPDRDLRNLQKIHVHAEGLPPRTVVQVLECAEGAKSSADCEGQSADVTQQTDANGVYDNPEYLVFTQPNPQFPSASITCDVNHACVLYVGVHYNDFTQPKAFVPISFAEAAVAPSTTPTTPAPKTTGNQLTIPLPVLIALLGAAGVIVVAVRRGRRRSGTRA